MYNPPPLKRALYQKKMLIKMLKKMLNSCTSVDKNSPSSGQATCSTQQYRRPYLADHRHDADRIPLDFYCGSVPCNLRCVGNWRKWCGEFRAAWWNTLRVLGDLAMLVLQRGYVCRPIASVRPSALKPWLWDRWSAQDLWLPRVLLGVCSQSWSACMSVLNVNFREC